MAKWEHCSVVLKLKQKGFAVSRYDLLQGLDDGSVDSLKKMGDDGWELITAIPFMSGKMGMFSDSRASTDSLIAFFKRPLIEANK